MDAGAHLPPAVYNLQEPLATNAWAAGQSHWESSQGNRLPDIPLSVRRSRAFLGFRNSLWLKLAVRIRAPKEIPDLLTYPP